MTPLITSALELQQFCEDKKWRFCFIGGLALQVWGQQRLTRDIDITLLTNFENEEVFVGALLQRYRGRLPDAANFALKNRVLLLETPGGIGIDISLGGLLFENDAVDRATYKRYSNEISLKTCSAEDLIVFKAVASRPQDWIDIESVIIKQKTLDWDYIEGYLTQFAEILYSRDALEVLQKLKDRFYRK
jgi:hypothetical protein